MKGFKVLKVGICDTIQDLGRYGFQQYGIPVSGAMDSFALRMGNRLLGNNDDEAGIEISSPGLSLEVLDQTVIAMTGGDFKPTINNSPVSMWSSIEVGKGDCISFNQIRNGSRSYLLVAGGIIVPSIFGSKSTYLPGKMGGIMGRKLKKDDLLNIGKQSYDKLENILGRTIPSNKIPAYKNENEIRVILGPQEDYFSSNGLDTFLNSAYFITVNSNRMGYRLDGPKIASKRGSDIVTDGIPLGSIQVPNDGMPIVMLADHQTTGGYAKIATVISVDIDKFAQMSPGNKIKFRQTNIAHAHKLLSEREDSIAKLLFKKEKINKPKAGHTRIFRVKVKGEIYKVEVEEL
ncbi:MAG: biotin-dependent carboxyltransferase family protein [bacterium]